MDSWRNDLMLGLRLLRRSPSFTLAAIVSLAIGIGANTAIFSVANALLLRPLPYADADRIAIIWQRSPGLNVPQDWLSIGQYLDISTDNTVFERTAAAIGASFNMTGKGKPERVDGIRVSSSFFPLFGAQASLGRVFSVEEDQPGRSPVALLTHGFWQRRFGGDPSVIGQTLVLNGISVTVVGVMTRDFAFDKEVMPAVNGIQRGDLLLPLPLPPSARAKRDGEDYNVFAKLKPDVPRARAQSQMDGLAARMKQQYPAAYPPNGGLTLSVVPLLDQVVGDMRLALYVLLGAVGFLLLIACGNVANLLLARAAVREKEMAIRAAVGARRSRIVRQLLTESALLSLAGGVAGMLLAIVAIQGVRFLGPSNIPRMSEVAIDPRVLGFTALATLVTSVLFGLLPSLRVARVDPNTVLKEGGRGSIGSASFGMGHGGLRKVLITGEIALCLVLLIGAGLLVRSYQRIASANPGFDARNVLSFRLSLPGAKYKSPELVSLFYQQLDRKLAALPGVENVGSNYQLPLSSVALAWEPIGIEGYVPKSAGDDLIIASSAYVSPGYLPVMGMPLDGGRNFDTHDTRSAPEVAIVNDKLAARFWPGQDPIGKRLRQGADGPWRTVVGVVGDTREYEPNAQPPITVYFPVEQYTIGSRFIVVRTKRAVDPASITAGITREIASIDAELPSYDVSTMEQRLHDSFARRRLSMFLLVTFAAFALVLAAIGVYGVIVYWVNQRRRDIGIHMALGADRARILRLVAREFLAMIGAGIAIGVLVAFAASRAMSGLIFGIAVTDVPTFAVIPLVIAAIALLATYLPARRATRVEPITALRDE